MLQIVFHASYTGIKTLSSYLFSDNLHTLDIRHCMLGPRVVEALFAYLPRGTRGLRALDNAVTLKAVRNLAFGRRTEKSSAESGGSLNYFRVLELGNSCPRSSRCKDFSELVVQTSGTRSSCHKI